MKTLHCALIAMLLEERPRELTFNHTYVNHCSFKLTAKPHTTRDHVTGSETELLKLIIKKYIKSTQVWWGRTS